MLVSDRPEVSVIIVFFDDDRFLAEAIESVLGQSFESWELLLVDDGSTDSSPQIARSWADREPDRIRYLFHPERANRGISASRNLGLRECRAELVALLDSDDLWLSDKLSGQVRILQQQPSVAMTYCRSLYWWSWNTRSERQDEIPAAGTLEDRVLDPPALLADLVSNRAAPALPSSLLFRLDAAQEVGGFEEAFPGLYEDQVFTAKMIARFPVWASSHCWVSYRRHPDSISLASQRAGPTRMAVARAGYLEWLGKYLGTIGLPEGNVWQEWRRQSWMYRHFRNQDPETIGTTRLDLWRWSKKWVLKAEEALLPNAIRKRIWRLPGRVEGA